MHAQLKVQVQVQAQVQLKVKEECSSARFCLLVLPIRLQDLLDRHLAERASPVVCLAISEPPRAAPARPVTARNVCTVLVSRKAEGALDRDLKLSLDEHALPDCVLCHLVHGVLFGLCHLHLCSDFFELVDILDAAKAV